MPRKLLDILKNIGYCNVSLGDIDINKGVELLLKGDPKKPEPKKTFEMRFSFFNREIDLSLDIKKKN